MEYLVLFVAFLVTLYSCCKEGSRNLTSKGHFIKPVDAKTAQYSSAVKKATTTSAMTNSRLGAIVVVWRHQYSLFCYIGARMLPITLVTPSQKGLLTRKVLGQTWHCTTRHTATVWSTVQLMQHLLRVAGSGGQEVGMSSPCGLLHYTFLAQLWDQWVWKICSLRMDYIYSLA